MFVLAVAATAWACVPFATLKVSPTTVQPGQEVTVTGGGFRSSVPVVLRLDALDGRVLAEIPTDTERGAFIKATFVLPADVAPGNHVLIATQDLPPWSSAPWGIPVRALITVGGGGEPAPPVLAQARQQTVDLQREPVSAVGFVTVVLAVASIMLLAFAGFAAVAARRRPPRPAPIVRS